MNIMNNIKNTISSKKELKSLILAKQFEVKTVSTSQIARMYDTIYGMPEPQDPSSQVFDYQDYVYNYEENNYDRILTLIPGDMQYNGSSSILNAWDFKPQVSDFNKQLGRIMMDIGGFSPIPSIPQTGIKFYCQEITMTESISNQYGDNTLSSINNLTSSLVGDYAYMSNGNWGTFTSMLENNLKGMLGNMANPIISGISSGKSAFTSLYNSGKHALQNNGANVKQSESLIKDLFSGYKVDLPKIWKNSTNGKQLTVKMSFFSTIDRVDALKERVTLPYALILLLSSPRSSKSYLYKWPFIVKAKLPGYFDVQLAAITDVQVTKGGSQNIRAYNNKYLAIDVSITLTPLYNTQFVAADGVLPKSMLTVNQELKMVDEYLSKSR